MKTKTKIPSPTLSRTLKNGASSRYFIEYFAIHQNIPEALVTEKPTVTPPTTVPSEGLRTSGPTREQSLPIASGHALGSTNQEEEVAGQPSSGTIGGRAFFDSNGNGVYDANDNGMADVVAWLFSCSGDLVANAKTSPEGFFLWEDIAWGDYFVVIQLPSGYVGATVWDGNIFDAITEPGRRDANGRTICFQIRDGGPSNVELTFGMQLAPTLSPSPTLSERPSGNPPVSVVPSLRPSRGPSRSLLPTPTPSYAPNLSKPPSAIPSEMESLPAPSVVRSVSPSNNQQPFSAATPSNNQQQSSFQSTHYPTRYGESVGPIQSNGLRIILFGIDKVPNEAEWNDGMALYINRYFNYQRDYAFDVNVDIIITKQTAKLDSLVEYTATSGRTRQSRKHISVEIVYDQTSTYKTIDPTFMDITYILQEPFAMAESRYNYISFLQLLSPSIYANVSSVSPVILPRQPPQRDNSPNNGNERIGLGFGIFFIIWGLVVFVLVPFGFFVHGQRRRRMPAESETNESEIREEMKERERTDGVLGTREVKSLSNDATHTSVTHSNCSEQIIEISIPPGRVGCVIDSNPRKGPYVCEIHDSSPLRYALRLGDRILSVDRQDVQEMSAIAVSKLLGSRSENDERRMTILREFSNDATVDESSEPHDGDEESKISVDPPGIRASDGSCSLLMIAQSTYVLHEKFNTETSLTDDDDWDFANASALWTSGLPTTTPTTPQPVQPCAGLTDVFRTAPRVL